MQAESSYRSPFRRSRSQVLKDLVRAALTRSPQLRVLDVGGRSVFWRDCGLDPGPALRITLLNLAFDPAEPDSGFIREVGDAVDLSRFADASFDLVVCNSVLAHIGGPDRQRLAAAEIRRVGRAYYVQTPNRFFPIDWVTLVPYFQLLPLETRARLLSRFRVGRQPRIPNLETARAWLRTKGEALTRGGLRDLFPDARLKAEFVPPVPIAKSWLALKG